LFGQDDAGTKLPTDALRIRQTKGAKKMTQTFEEKVKAMTSRQIIMAMVNGLKNPKVKVDMISFGKSVDNVCYGCAATCAVLQIADVKPVPALMDMSEHNELLDGDWLFIAEFETAIDNLRRNKVQEYNKIARKRGFATIRRRQGFSLPRLDNSNYMTGLPRYEQLAEMQYTTQEISERLSESTKRLAESVKRAAESKERLAEAKERLAEATERAAESAKRVAESTKRAAESAKRAAESKERLVAMQCTR
jgi:hypothetical protein